MQSTTRIPMLALVAGLALSLPASADVGPGTPVSGNIVGETWTPAGSPYRVQGDVVLINVDIQPGVCVLVEGNYEILVGTVVTAVGTFRDPIIFTAADPAVRWKGIRFQDLPMPSLLEHCRVEYSNSSGIEIDNSLPIIRNCLIRNNTAANGGDSA